MEQSTVHGTDDQRTDHTVLLLAHGKLRADAVIDGRGQPLFVVFRSQGVTGAIGVNRQSQRQWLEFVPQFNGLRDFSDDRPAQQRDQLFHGGVRHQGFFQCQDQQFVFAGGAQIDLGIRVFQIVLLADDGPYEPADFLVGQAFMA